VNARRFAVALVVLLCSSSALAQPRGGLTPQGGTVVGVTATAGGGVVIGGTATLPSVGLTTGCSATNVLAWSGSVWACSAGGGITNGAGNNVIPKSNGTNLVASSISDNGTTISTSEIVTLTGQLNAHGNVDVVGNLVVNSGSLVTVGSATSFLSNVTSTSGTNTLGNLTLSPVTPASFNTIQNDYAGCSATATICRLNCTAGSCDFTGISGGVDGRQLVLENIGSGNIVLYHQNTNSTTPADRFLMTSGTQTTMLSGGHIPIFYDGTQSRWMLDQQWTGSTWIGAFVGASTVASVGLMTATNGFSITGQHFLAASPSVAFSSCGSAPAPVCNSTSCNDMAGTFTTGGSGVTTCTITFANTYTGADDASCVVQPMGSPTMPTFTTSATAITMSTSQTTTKYHYICVGH
jgi:hypothetical protein